VKGYNKIRDMLTNEDIKKLSEVLATKEDINDLKQDVNGLREMVQSLVVSVDKLVKAVSTSRPNMQLSPIRLIVTKGGFIKLLKN
jgi:uncharacterized protein YoxC